MKESISKKAILAIVMLIWASILGVNLFHYTPNSFWTTSAGTMLQSLLVILLTYLLTNRNADDRKKAESLSNAITHILNTMIELNILVEKYFDTIDGPKKPDTDSLTRIYQSILINKRNINNYLDILSYYPTTTEFNNCVQEIRGHLNKYFTLFEEECPVAQEPIPSRTKNDFSKVYSLIYQKVILLQTLVYFGKKARKIGASKNG